MNIANFYIKYGQVLGINKSKTNDNIIDNWLEKNGDPEVNKRVQLDLEIMIDND